MQRERHFQHFSNAPGEWRVIIISRNENQNKTPVEQKKMFTLYKKYPWASMLTQTEMDFGANPHAAY